MKRGDPFSQYGDEGFFYDGGQDERCEVSSYYNSVRHFIM